MLMRRLKGIGLIDDRRSQRPFNSSRAFSTAALLVFLPLSISSLQEKQEQGSSGYLVLEPVTMRICDILPVLLCLFINRSGLCQCGTVLSVQTPSIELRVSDSTVFHGGRSFRLLLGTPVRDETMLTFSQGQASERYVAFYPNGRTAFTEEHGKRGFSKTWYYDNGQVRDQDSLYLKSKHRGNRIHSAFFRDGRRDEFWAVNDTVEYHLDLDMEGDTMRYSFTDLRKGATPYRVVIANVCGKRKEVRFYSTLKRQYAFQYFEGGALQDFGVCEDPEWELVGLLHGN